jgi:hypothetical protein
MISFRLQKEIVYEGISYPINTDYRDVLVIMSAFEDSKLGDWDKLIVLWDLIFTYEDETPPMTNESLNIVMDFLNGGLKVSDTGTKQRLYSWDTDSAYIINAISKMVQHSIRDIEYLHWHDFIGFFSEIGESTFATIVSIRQKKQKGKELDKGEKDFYKNNYAIIDALSDKDNLGVSDLEALVESMQKAR